MHPNVLQCSLVSVYCNVFVLYGSWPSCLAISISSCLSVATQFLSDQFLVRVSVPIINPTLSGGRNDGLCKEIWNIHRRYNNVLVMGSVELYRVCVEFTNHESVCLSVCPVCSDTGLVPQPGCGGGDGVCLQYRELQADQGGSGLSDGTGQEEV